MYCIGTLTRYSAKITLTNALQNRCYMCIQWVLYSVVITQQSHPPISQFKILCNQFMIVWSMFVYNIVIQNKQTMKDRILLISISRFFYLAHFVAKAIIIIIAFTHFLWLFSWKGGLLYFCFSFMYINLINICFISALQWPSTYNFNFVSNLIVITVLNFCFVVVMCLLLECLCVIHLYYYFLTFSWYTNKRNMHKIMFCCSPCSANNFRKMNMYISLVLHLYQFSLCFKYQHEINYWFYFIYDMSVTKTNQVNLI